jgi:hypothetical protein
LTSYGTAVAAFIALQQTVAAERRRRAEAVTAAAAVAAVGRRTSAEARAAAEEKAEGKGLPLYQSEQWGFSAGWLGTIWHKYYLCLFGLIWSS